jgi:hypothetical protein
MRISAANLTDALSVSPPIMQQYLRVQQGDILVVAAALTAR